MIRLVYTITILAAAVCLSVARCVAQEKAPSTKAPSAGEIAELVQRLGHDEYPVRVQATERLRAIGLPAKPHLVKALDSKDLEVCTRAWDILVEIARRHGGDKPRYIGVQLEPDTLKVINVLEASPAARAGLRPGDEILTINGRAVPDFDGLVEAVQVFDRMKMVVSRSTDGGERKVALNVTVADGDKVFRPKEDDLPARLPVFPE